MEPEKRREGLHRFLVASICTAARPDAIFDMSIVPSRFQWDKPRSFFDLNPQGREQTKKFRPVLPVIPTFKALLETANEDGWVMHYYGRKIINVRTAWRSMIADLELGDGRGWGAYVMRRSMSQLLREGQASPWDVQGLMGHRVAGTTETYTAASLFPTAITRIERIIADIEDSLGKSVSTFTRK